MLGRILALGPTVYAVRWKENVYLGMVVHCTGNTLRIILLGNQGPQSSLMVIPAAASAVRE